MAEHFVNTVFAKMKVAETKLGEQAVLNVSLSNQEKTASCSLVAAAEVNPATPFVARATWKAYSPV